MVVEGDLRPAGALHCNGQTASASLPCPDAELRWQKQRILSLSTFVSVISKSKKKTKKQIKKQNRSEGCHNVCICDMTSSMRLVCVCVCTWLPCLCSFQARTSNSDLGGPALAQRSHGELEGATRHVLSACPHAHTVHAHLSGHKAHAVGVVAEGNKLGGTACSGGGEDLGSDVLQVHSCKETFVHVWTDAAIFVSTILFLQKYLRSRTGDGISLILAALPYVLILPYVKMINNNHPDERKEQEDQEEV